MGILVNGQELDAPAGLVVKNYKDPSVFHFHNQARVSHGVTEVVVHETVSSSWLETVAILKQRGLGVHFIADHDGTIYQHADLFLEEMWHASQHNGMSVGIETVNPYEPATAPKNGPWTNVISDAPWSGSQHPVRQYLVPTPEQSEAVCQLLNWLSSAAANPLTIPQKWPGLELKEGKTLLSLTRVAACAKPPEPGILSHMYFGHSDGAWLVLYAWLRLEAQLDPQTAYTEAQRRATGVMAADLTDLFAANPYLVV